MFRRTLVRRIATQDVVSLHLRPRGRSPPPALRRTPTSLPTDVNAGRAPFTTGPAHDSLATFLDHAKRTQLDRASTTFAGTYYEYATQALLRRYGFALTRVGGRGDHGVDLKGTWTVTAADDEKIALELPVIVQCKRLKSKVGPNLIRELEGAMAGRSNTLGVLVGTKGATKGVRDAMGRSRVGICWVMLEVEEEAGGAGEEDAEEEEEGEVAEEKGQGQGLDGVLQAMKDEIVSKSPKTVRDFLGPSGEHPATSNPEESVQDVPVQLGHVRQMLWNRAASNMGLEGLDVTVQYENGGVGKVIKLMWRGKQVVEMNTKE